ncbi:MAG: AAA family ATPase [Candidatus Micrarchaeota archaeon]|nr:AAA family ATPase [Candidatus Micrarchaeota archaeon]
MKIAISGYVGTGKTTLGLALSKYLKEKYNIDIEPITMTFKELAKKKGMTLEEFQLLAQKDPNIDKEFDKALLEKASQKPNAIVATWLAVWLFKDADLKIFLTTNLEERIRRLMERDNMSYEEAKEHILLRDKQNHDRYLKVYGIDISRPMDVAHLILDTAYYSVEDELKVIETTLKQKNLLPQKE